MSPATASQERDEHLKHYHEAIRAYRIAVFGLELDLAPDMFETAYKGAQDARRVFEHARQQLRSHVSAHGCRREVSM